MKLKNESSYLKSSSIRNKGPRNTYSYGFEDSTRGFAMVISGGRMIEKSNRRKIFYQLYC